MAKVIREGFLQQERLPRDGHLHEAGGPDVHAARVILRLYDGAKDLVAQNIPLRQLVDTGVFTALERMKFELGGGKPGSRVHGACGQRRGLRAPRKRIGVAECA